MAEGGAGPSKEVEGGGKDDAKLAELLQGPGFAIYPLAWCPHLDTGLASTPPESLDCKAACTDCKDQKENWFCLSCHVTHCSRYINGHQVDHHAASHHSLALSYSDLSVWCFDCDSYVDNELLYHVKNLAHQDKFGEAMLKPDYAKEAGATFDLV